MNLNQEILENQNSSAAHQAEEINDDILQDVAGGMKKPHDALEKWIKFDKNFNKFNKHS